MDKYKKATDYLNSMGCKAQVWCGHGVAVLMHNDDPNKLRWTDIQDYDIDYYAELYDKEHSGYAMLKKVAAWADKQVESQIIRLSFDELVNKYKKENY